MILFLDVDGVLHPEPCYDRSKLFCHRNLLEDCLSQFPEVEIVITSTWREKYALFDLQSFFTSEVAAMIIDVTPNWRDVSDLDDVIRYQRQTEIEGWLRRAEMLRRI